MSPETKRHSKLKSPKTVKSLETLGRVRLSENFFMRDFLHSEISQIERIPNIPDDPDTAIAAGRKLCEELLEPLSNSFGRVAVRFAYRSSAVNEVGAANKNQYNCSANERNYAGHIWDKRDSNGYMGATACIVIPWFVNRYENGEDWRSLAWWIHDHLNYSAMYFFPKLSAFNLTWHEKPKRVISSYIAPKGILTKLGMDNHDGDHSEYYQGFPNLVKHV
jgi:hypothetical protein